MGGLEGPYISQNPIWVRSRVLLHSPVKNQVKLFTYKDNMPISTIPDISHIKSTPKKCTTPPFNRNFGIFLGWHVIIWDGSQVKAFPNPDHPPLAIFLTYQAFCTGMKILHLILLRCIKLKSESFLLL